MSTDPTLTALLEAAASRWDDDGPHHALLEYARASGKLGDVASFYRAQSAQPGRGERCKAQLSALLTLAMASLDVRRAEAPNTRRWAFIALSLIFLALTAVLLWKGL